MAGAKRNWIQEERRKTLGDWIAFSSLGNPWFPHAPPPHANIAGRPSRASRRAKPGFGGGRRLTEAAPDG